MNQGMEPRLHRSLLRRMTLTVLVIFTLYAIVMTTLYIKTETDISFMIPVLIDVVPYVTDLCELIGILVAYTAILFAARSASPAQWRGYIISFTLLTVYKYIAKIVVTIITNGSLPSVKSLFIDILLGVLLPLALEMVQLVIVLLIIKAVMHHAEEFINERKSLEGKLESYHFDEDAFFFPFTSLINKHNPLQRSALWMGVVITISKAAQLLINDIMIGPPQDIEDLLWMLLYYSMCAVVGFASYLGMLMGLMTLRGCELKFRSFNKI